MLEVSSMRNRKPSMAVSKSLNALKRFDVYQKVHEDYQVRTGSGGLLSLFAGFIILILFYSEFSAYMTTEVQDHIGVDKLYYEKLHVMINVSFPHLRCDEVRSLQSESTQCCQLQIIIYTGLHMM
mgnify:CR=1 FL=1